MFESVYSQEQLKEGRYEHQREKHNGLEQHLCTRRMATLCDKVQGISGAVLLGAGSLHIFDQTMEQFTGRRPALEPFYNAIHISPELVLGVALLISIASALYGDACYSVLYPSGEDDRKPYKRNSSRSIYAPVAKR